ncbi:hypothetical protein X975_18934, partial [Stegodyphus mimosarum]
FVFNFFKRLFDLISVERFVFIFDGVYIHHFGFYRIEKY